MRPLLLKPLAPALVVATFALPGAALAQAAPGGNPADLGGNPAVSAAPQANPNGTPGEAGRNREDRVEGRIAGLHARLHITQAQEPQWQQFAQVMRDNARALDQAYEQRFQRLSSMTAPENMQSYAQIAEQQAQDAQKLVPAFQALYSTLSDQQKQAADQVFRGVAERFARRHGHPG